MKYSFFRLMRDWTFWAVILLSIVFIIGFSAFYLKECEPAGHTWYYKVSSYKTEADLNSQIEDVKTLKADVEAEIPSSSISEKQDLLEEKQWLEASENILGYLKKNINKYSYSNICDSTYMEAGDKTSVSYFYECFECLVFFQLVAMIFSVGQIVCQDKCSGNFVIPTLMRGRKKIFSRQLASSAFVWTLSLLVQVILMAVISLMLSDDSQYILFYDNGEITVLSAATEFALMSVHMFAVLIPYWAMIFLCSQVIDNPVAFSLTSVLLCAGFVLSAYYIETGLLSKFNCPPSSVLTELISTGEFVCIFVIRTVLTAALLVLSYIVAKRKNYRIRYE